MINTNKLKGFACILFSLFYLNGYSAISDTTSYFNDVEALTPFFVKLDSLERFKKGKINIVHIGDSHIQADFMTDAIRQPLQTRFGNAGAGLLFPHRLLRTNGSRRATYISNATWLGHMCAQRALDSRVGISGFVMSTTSTDFLLELTVKEEEYSFNTIKLIYPTKNAQYKMSNSAELLEVTKAITPVTSGTKTHRIKSGESLSVIANKYKVGLSQLKKANNLKSNNIRAGQNLKIPTNVPAVTETKIKISDNIEFLPLKTGKYHTEYTSNTLMDRMVLFPDRNTQETSSTLNGIVLEKKEPGIIYHTIGVNGAQIADYNKYKLFFEQLPILQPDLVILSFGTNESFGRMAASDFIRELNTCIENIKEHNPNAIVLVTTPAPSMLRKRKPNVYVDRIAQALINQKNIFVWDLYTQMGGIGGIIPQGKSVRYINRDRIHYIESGYQYQGNLFYTDLMTAYEKYKKQK